MRICFALLAVLISLFSYADTLEDALQHCRSIMPSADRLSCYDAIPPKAPSVPSAVAETPTPVTATHTTAPAMQTRLVDYFGFEEKAIAKQMPDTIDVEIADVSTNNGKLTITLNNGQIWRQTDNKLYHYKTEDGQAYIQRGALSSFFFSQQGVKTRIRVKRLQ